MEYKKNDILTVKIEDMGNDGEGIGKIDGFTLFVKDAVIGDTVQAKIMKKKKNYAYARLEKVVTPSFFRVEPKCAFHRQCGGCQIQSISYEKQLEFKQKKIANNLVRIGGFDTDFVNSVMDPIIGMENPYRYRNKAQYPVGVDKNGELITGFYAGRTHDIIANTNCLLGAESNQEILEAVLDYMRENHVSAYEETTGKGLVRHIFIRTGFISGEIMVCLVVNADSQGKSFVLPHQEKLIEKLSKINNLASVSVSINSQKTNVIMGKEIHTIWGEETISDTIHVRDMSKEGYPFTGQQLTFRISPLSFYQVNPVQTEKLYSLALEYAGLTGEETVWDLYCGIGTISLFLSLRAKKVYGVEIIPQAIEDAKENARINQIENAEFFVGKAEEVLPEFYRGEIDENRKTDQAKTDHKKMELKIEEENKYVNTDMLHPDVIVVDPPRKGCDETCLQTMIQMNPDRIVYVSCDSATLARDLRILCDGGYEIRKVRGVDQFAQTVSVETVVQLSKGDIDRGNSERSDAVKAGDFGMISGYSKGNKASETTNVKIDFSLENLDMSELGGKAIYEQIKDYVREQTGFRVSTLYISQVKRKCGLEVGESYNKPKSEDAKQPQCTPEKEAAIMQALRHYGVI